MNMTTPQDPRSIDAIIDSFDGGPAFPQPQGKDEDGAPYSAREIPGDSGMSLRDWFAGMALPTLLAQLGSIDKEAARSEVESGELSWHEVIKATDADIIVPKYDVAAFGAYLVADAMLAARKENL